MAVVSTGYEYNFVETIGDQTTNIQKKQGWLLNIYYYTQEAPFMFYIL